MKKILNYHPNSLHFNPESAFFGLRLILIALAFPLFSYMELTHSKANPINSGSLLRAENAVQNQNETAASFQKTINSTNF